MRIATQIVGAVIVAAVLALPGERPRSFSEHYAAVVSAQTPVAVTPGKTVMQFPHDGLDTEYYELCVGSVTPCLKVDAKRQGTSTTWQFTLPTKVPAGTQSYVVWAVGPGGRTGGTPVTFRVPGKPSAPGALQRVS